MEALLDGRYRLGPVLGSGGMGIVHRARDERLGRDVAVKVLRAGADELEAERLRREARFLAALRHPNLVEVLDAGADDERTWFAMELVAGHDLRQDLAAHGPMPSSGVRTMLAGAAAALAALHDAGVVHRDLKPANVLLADDGEVKIADLGIAQLLRSDRLTATGQVMGTAAYLSPEQVAGRPVGTPTDVYSLGLVVLEALSGEIAFPGPVAEAAAVRLIRGPIIPAWIDGGWRELLQAMTAQNPAERPVARRIAAAVAALPELPPAPPVAASSLDGPTRAMAAVTNVLPVVRRPRRNRLLVSAVSVAAALLLAGGGVALLNPAAPAAEKAVAAPVSTSPARTTPAPVARTSTPTPTPTSTPSRQPIAATLPSTSPLRPTQNLGEQRRERWKRNIERWRERLRHLGVGLPSGGVAGG